MDNLWHRRYHCNCPWKFIVRRVARAHGFLDPIALLARLRRFGQPSEVHEPIELLRAGVVLHARGLLNSRVLQHNLDWVWPYWVERQFDPKDDAFIPRAFSLTIINLTHRNWTAIGLPDCPELPIVDPSGLLTPFFDGWSLDGWILTEDGRFLLPSHSASSVQRINLGESLAVKTETHQDNLSLITHAEVQLKDETPTCRMRLNACADTKAWAIVALRPYNPEGVSFIHKIALSPDRMTWAINGRSAVEFSAPVDRHHVSRYRTGDVYSHLRDLTEKNQIKGEAGMATAAALFNLEPDKPRDIVVSVPLEIDRSPTHLANSSWHEIMRNRCELHIPDEDFQFLYDVALRTLVLNSPGDVYPGPFTYKRFWFRDAAFIIYALLCAGFIDRAERALDRFPARQNAFGFFHSQDGEWDSNGEALWIIYRFCRLTGRPPKDNWWKSILRGARWISKKRLPDDHNSPHSGLLPAGFSAEHLGPNDYYYWDDFWGISGLRAAAGLAGSMGHNKDREEFLDEATAFSAAVDRSLNKASRRLGRPAMPASPYRRLDSGAIGSLAAGYPLRLLRAGNPRYFDLMTSVAKFASPTGQWPEAIHPHTRGGCMGDGQHVWAAAEWVLMIRNCFVREEGNRLILASGIPQRWLSGRSTLSFGPAPTSFGTLSLSIKPEKHSIIISWQGVWHAEAPRIEVRISGFNPIIAEPDQDSIKLDRRSKS
jgi:hypothetical protein